MPRVIYGLAASSALLIVLLWPAVSAALTVGGQLLVTVNGANAQTALGGADAAANTPLMVAVAPGDVLNVFVQIGFGLPIRSYATAISAGDPFPVDYIAGSASDVSTLGFLFDPDATLQDDTPGDGRGDSNLCAVGACTAPSTNTLYELSWVVQPGFAATGLRDITIAIDSILFDRPEDSLDPGADTMSIALIPEPATAGLLAVGLLALGARRRSSR